INGARGEKSATRGRMMGFGPVALHVAGTQEVKFRDIAIKDFNGKTEPAEQVSSHFKMQRLNDFFYSWGATAGDINHDGVMDVIAGPFYFLGPDYTERHEFTAARSYSASNNFPEGMVYYYYDLPVDGWPHGCSEQSRLVGATRRRCRRRALEIPCGAVRQRRSRNGSLRREWRRPERCGDGHGRPCVGTRVVRTEARSSGQHLFRASRHH